MRPMKLAGAIAMMLCAIAATAQQNDIYSRITPLEASVAAGTATPADRQHCHRSDGHRRDP